MKIKKLTIVLAIVSIWFPAKNFCMEMENSNESEKQSDYYFHRNLSPRIRYRIQFSPDSNFFYLTDSEKIILYNLQNKSEVFNVRGHKPNFSPNSNFFCSTNSEDITLCDLQNNTHVLIKGNRPFFTKNSEYLCYKNDNNAYHHLLTESQNSISKNFENSKKASSLQCRIGDYTHAIRDSSTREMGVILHDDGNEEICSFKVATQTIEIFKKTNDKKKFFNGLMLVKKLEGINILKKFYRCICHSCKGNYNLANAYKRNVLTVVKDKILYKSTTQILGKTSCHTIAILDLEGNLILKPTLNEKDIPRTSAGKKLFYQTGPNLKFIAKMSIDALEISSLDLESETPYMFKNEIGKLLKTPIHQYNNILQKELRKEQRQKELREKQRREELQTQQAENASPQEETTLSTGQKILRVGAVTGVTIVALSLLKKFFKRNQ